MTIINIYKALTTYHCSYVCFHLFAPWNHPARWIPSVSPFYRWRNWAGKNQNLPKFTQLIRCSGTAQYARLFILPVQGSDGVLTMLGRLSSLPIPVLLPLLFLNNLVVENTSFHCTFFLYLFLPLDCELPEDKSHTFLMVLTTSVWPVA